MTHDSVAFALMTGVFCIQKSVLVQQLRMFFDPRKQQLRELREQDKRRQEERRLEEERQKRLRETHGEPVLSEPKPEKSKVTTEVKAESPKPEVQKEVGFQVLGG